LQITEIKVWQKT